MEKENKNIIKVSLALGIVISIISFVYNEVYIVKNYIGWFFFDLLFYFSLIFIMIKGYFLIKSNEFKWYYVIMYLLVLVISAAILLLFFISESLSVGLF